MDREVAAARPFGQVVVGPAALETALRGDVARVISFGLCGGLDPTLTAGDLVIGTWVHFGDERYPIDEDWLRGLSRSLPEATAGGIVGTNAIVAGADAKAALRAASGGVAADMESHHAAKMASEAGVPFAVLRAVSDGAGESLPACAQAGFRADGSVDVGAVVRGLLARPSEFPALMRTARNAGKAMAALAEAARRLSSAR
jgi:hopanoid-associated phosphorylase